jgi:hypothetical protein
MAISATTALLSTSDQALLGSGDSQPVVLRSHISYLLLAGGTHGVRLSSHTGQTRALLKSHGVRFRFSHTRSRRTRTSRKPTMQRATTTRSVEVSHTMRCLIHHEVSNRAWGIRDMGLPRCHEGDVAIPHTKKSTWSWGSLALTKNLPWRRAIPIPTGGTLVIGHPLEHCRAPHCGQGRKRSR